MSWPVGRVLSSRASRPAAMGDHPSGTPVARRLVRSTRELGRAALERSRRSGGPDPLDLAPGGVYRAVPVTRHAGGLLHHRFTLAARPCRSTAGGGLFSVALSRGSPRVGVTHHPALWSPDLPRPAAPGYDAAVARPAHPPAQCRAIGAGQGEGEPDPASRRVGLGQAHGHVLAQRQRQPSLDSSRASTAGSPTMTSPWRRLLAGDRDDHAGERLAHALLEDDRLDQVEHLPLVGLARRADSRIIVREGGQRLPCPVRARPRPAHSATHTSPAYRSTRRRSGAVDVGVLRGDGRVPRCLGQAAVEGDVARAPQQRRGGVSRAAWPGRVGSRLRTRSGYDCSARPVDAERGRDAAQPRDAAGVRRAAGSAARRPRRRPSARRRPCR